MNANLISSLPYTPAVPTQDPARFVAPLYGLQGAIPKTDLYKLFIDQDRQHEGHDAFDVKEPGYEKAMTRAFIKMERSLGKKLNAKSLERMHDYCVSGVYSRVNREWEKFILGYHSNMMYRFGAESKGLTISEDAKAELISERLIGGSIADSDLYLSYWNIWNGDLCVASSYRMDGSVARVKEVINQFFDLYYQQIQVAQSEDDKLAAIANLCRAIEIYHVFRDGNQRTIAFLLLNRLLRENGIAHGVILKFPHMFDGYCSTKEMVHRIKEGIGNFYQEFPALATWRLT